MKITKTCSNCKRDLPLDSFRKQSSSKDGLQYECRGCTSARAARRYKENPEILKDHKKWQEENKGKHNDASKRYYYSLTGRMNRSLNNTLDELFSRKRETFFHIVGTSVSALVIHLMQTIPKHLNIDDYQETWFVGFVNEPDFNTLTNPAMIRDSFHWQNLCAKEKGVIDGDFGVSIKDD